MSHNTAGAAFPVRHSLSISGPIRARFHRAENTEAPVANVTNSKFMFNSARSFAGVARGLDWVLFNILHIIIIF